MDSDTVIYIVSGFMDAGKTTFINQLLTERKKQGIHKLVIQFEDGEEELSGQIKHLDCAQIERLELDHSPEAVKEKIACLIQENDYDEVWIEWNGMVDFHELETILLTEKSMFSSHIEKTIYLLDAVHAEMMLTQMGNEPLSQLINADIVLLKNCENRKDAKLHKLYRDIQKLNRTAEVVSDFRAACHFLRQKKKDTFTFMFGILVILALYIFTAPVFEEFGFPLNSWFTAITGILLEGMPFLFIGTLLSAFIQVMLPDGFLQRIFPKKILAGIVAAILLGFCLPVCDCATVPVFKGLIKKGVPHGAAVTFLVVTPIINPIVLLSTYYAFGNSVRVVLMRAALGIVAASVMGLIFSIKKEEVRLKRYDLTDICSCCVDVTQSKNRYGKIMLLFRQAGEDFLGVVKYLLIGGVISATFQILIKNWNMDTGKIPAFIMLAALMVFAFFLSLCSTSDAVIARSLANQFPFTAAMGFMVFGPMMDMKNYLMLKDGFSGKFVRQLLIITFLTCYAVVLLFTVLGGGSLER